MTAAVGAALFFWGGPMRAADPAFTIYFTDSKLMLKPEVVNRVIYLPLMDIVRFLSIPYTDALALETLTLRGQQARMVLTRNSGLISINDQIVLLRNPVLKEDERWLVPVDFLTQGLARVTGGEFDYRPGASRAFAENVKPAELVMNAQVLGSMTRLTIRAGASLDLELKRDDANTRAVLTLGSRPLDPYREALDHKDRRVESIAFDDSDGNPKIVLELTDEVSEIKVSPAENNRVFFIDVLRATETAAAPGAAEPAPAPTAPARPDVVPLERRMRVIVIDAGHGGMDSGTVNGAITEKDLTLALARRLRTALQSRLGTTVLLTRDSDQAIDNESRSAVANNNQANLFISLHVGHSFNKLAAGSSLFIMPDDFGESVSPEAVSRNRLFLPWYLGYKRSRPGSGRLATLFQEELAKTITGWKFPVRTAPLAVLSSAMMPSILLEVGNINNSINAQTMTDIAFQDKLTTAIVDAVLRFSETQQPLMN